MSGTQGIGDALALQMARMRQAVRPLLIDTGISEVPVGVWGTCFLVNFQARIFAVTAKHLVSGNHSGEIRLLGSDRSRRRIPLSQGFGAHADDSADEADLMVFPASTVGLSRREMKLGRMFNLDRTGIQSWRPLAETSQFVVIGYPREHSKVDYDRGVVTSGQVLISGRYVGPVNGSSCLHRISVDNSLHLSEFAGFSGAPVFAVEHHIGALPNFRFAGVAVSGTPASESMQFVDAGKLAELLHSVIDHIRRFGLLLPEEIPKFQR